MRWYFMSGPGGTIACKGDYRAQAVQEAAERWGCGLDEIEVTGEEPYRGSGENGSFGAARNDRGAEVRGPYVGRRPGVWPPYGGGMAHRCAPLQGVGRGPYEEENAASGAGTSEAAEMVPNEERAGELGPYGHLHDNTF